MHSLFFQVSEKKLDELLWPVYKYILRKDSKVKKYVINLVVNAVALPGKFHQKVLAERQFANI